LADYSQMIAGLANRPNLPFLIQEIENLIAADVKEPV
jgi:hypothetical protein